ncbi:MAG TPA: glycosyltransferase family 2 protein [Sedimentisphaerales bacterium]|nr:glycosyltransferase family 2 protein [Sedimentisphaerales bacterium]
MNRTDVTIVIVSWNTREILRDCLRSVYANSGPVDFDVIVVDNASADGSVEMVRTEFDKVHLIANFHNRGFAAANNQGMAVARGRYVLLLNSDTIVLDGAIAKAVAFSDAHPDSGVVGCRVLNRDRSLQATCFMYPSVLNLLLATLYLNRLFPRSRFFGREQMTWWGRDEEREVEVVTGCFMLVRREAIDQVGVMDEDYFMYGEETDWCWRFRRAGWRLRFTPSAQIIHLGGQSTAQVRPQMLLQLRSAVLQFLGKWRTGPEYAAACLLTSLWFVLRVPPWALRALVSGADRANSLVLVRTYLQGGLRSLGGWRMLCARR